MSRTPSDEVLNDMRDFRGGCGWRVLLVFLFAAGCEDRPVPGKYGPLDTLTVQVTGDDFQWYNRYPGVDGQLDTEDDIVSIRALHVPVNTRTTLLLSSRDYVYTLTLPHLDLREVAVPDLVFSMEFQERVTGTYPLRGSQMCGFTHPNLLGDLIVEPRDRFEAWLDGLEHQR